MNEKLKRFDLVLTDNNNVPVVEGSILGIIATKGKGYPSETIGTLIKKKVVFGNANTDESDTSTYTGFWAVSMDVPNTNFNGGINFYNIVTSIHYLIRSNKAEVIGNVHDDPDIDDLPF